MNARRSRATTDPALVVTGNIGKRPDAERPFIGLTGTGRFATKGAPHSPLTTKLRPSAPLSATLAPVTRAMADAAEGSGTAAKRNDKVNRAQYYTTRPGRGVRKPSALGSKKHGAVKRSLPEKRVWAIETPVRRVVFVGRDERFANRESAPREPYNAKSLCGRAL